MEGINVKIDKPLAKYDFTRLLGFCLPLADGSMFKRESNITTVLVESHHVYGANLVLQKYGLRIEKEQVVIFKANVETDDKQRMPTIIKVLENGFDVNENGRCSFIPFSNIDLFIDTLYEDLECNNTTVIEPRRLWSLLSDAYKLTPEINEAIEVVKQSNLSQTKKDWIISGLHKSKSGLFEGKRVSKKGDNNTYYSMYNLPCLILKKMELIFQIPPNRELGFMPSLKEIADIDWQAKAREMFR